MLQQARHVTRPVLIHQRSLASAILTTTTPARWRRAPYSTAPSANGFDDYEAEFKSFKFPRPEVYNFAVNVIDQWAKKEQSGERSLDNPALWWVGEDGREIKWSFQQLSGQSRRVASVLGGACKLGLGDRVIVILPKVPQWWLISLACIRAGIVIIPGTTLLTEKDILLRLKASGAKCIITDEETADKVDNVIGAAETIRTKLLVTEDSMLRRPGWLNFCDLYNQTTEDYKGVVTKASDPMVIYFTSGTTGAPKMCEHTQASYGIGHMNTSRFWLDQTATDVNWTLSDPGWAKAAYGNVFGPWHAGACVFVHQDPKFDPKHTLQLLTEYPISTFCAPPTAYRMMVLEQMTDYKLKRARHMLSAGEPLNPEVMEDWLNGTGHHIREGYGQTEMTLAVGTFRCIPIKPGSMGKACPGVDVQIVDDRGRLVEDGEEGNIAIRANPMPVNLFKRYVGEPDRTKRCFVGDYFITGDHGHRDKDGYFWFSARSDDVINSAGYRIGPFEVESALIEHPAVAESAVVSSPDPVRGEVVKAFVIRTPDFVEADSEQLTRDLQEHVKKTTAPYKYPRRIEFVSELPKTVSGKIRRVELRQSEWAGHGSRSSS